jgi:cytochrome c5
VFQSNGKSFSVKCLFVAILFMLPVSMLSAASNEAIIKRIAPAGSVCLLGDSCAGSATLASAGEAGPQDPVQVYNTYCVACHGSGANNAPILGDAAAWQPRVDKGVETLYGSVINGFNNGAMPVKGLCMGCSDADLQSVVDYMLDAL